MHRTTDLASLLDRVPQIAAEYARLLQASEAEGLDDLSPAQHATAADLMDELARLAEDLVAHVKAKADYHRQHQWPTGEGS